jgi:methylated-DNA-protein-cysteine methyltransferase related protein
MRRTPPNPDQFNALVWTITRQIPAGNVSTYGQIASMIPPPDPIDPADYARLGALWVGQALNQTPADQGIPWQRVINSKGEIALPGQAAKQQRALLEAEDIRFDGQDRVNLNQYGWQGPDDDWLKAQGLLQPRPIRKPGDDARQLPLF